jgi:hypothetical protein
MSDKLQFVDHLQRLWLSISPELEVSTNCVSGWVKHSTDAIHKWVVSFFHPLTQVVLTSLRQVAVRQPAMTIGSRYIVIPKARSRDHLQQDKPIAGIRFVWRLVQKISTALTKK